MQWLKIPRNGESQDFLLNCKNLQYEFVIGGQERKDKRLGEEKYKTQLEEKLDELCWLNVGNMISVNKYHLAASVELSFTF